MHREIKTRARSDAWKSRMVDMIFGECSPKQVATPENAEYLDFHVLSACPIPASNAISINLARSVACNLRRTFEM